MEGLINCVADNNVFVWTKFYVNRYNAIPSRLTLTFNEDFKQCDLSKITDAFIKDTLGGTIVERICSKYTRVTNSIEEPSDNFIISTSGTCVKFEIGNKMYSICCDAITCLYTLESEEDIEAELMRIWESLPKKQKEAKEAIVNLVGYSNGEYYTIESKIKTVDIDIEENYNDDFIPVHNDVIRFLNNRESGLVLLFGIAGSGKSSYIRHLCNRYPQTYIIVPTSLTSRLGDPDFVSFMIDNSNSVFVLEDCEQVLMDRGVNMFNGAISNILNMSDGLLSDVMNIKFICTFNADIRTIDPALLRKGRCYAKYEFRELSEDKVEALNNKYNLGIDIIKPMTLAEVYNMDKTEYLDKKGKKKIGF